jgi:predicted transposase YdaD
LIKIINKNTDGEYMTTIERWRTESKQEGRQEGVHIGEDNVRHEMALEMLKSGDTVTKVVSISKLSVDEVLKLKASITH